MLLTFNSSHLSIYEFPDIELPDFVLLTGPNGVGKSHFLQAVHTNHIRIDHAQAGSPEDEIRLYDWNALLPNESQLFTGQNWRSERRNLFNQLDALLRQAIDPLRSIARECGFPEKYVSDVTSFAKLSKEEFLSLAEKDNGSRYDELLALQVEIDEWVLSQFDPQTRALVRAAATKAGLPLSGLSENDFLQGSVTGWGHNRLFQQSFGMLFAAYRDSYRQNLMAELQASRGHHADYLSEEKFFEKNGPFPWDFVNDALKTAGLDFTISSPILLDDDPYQPTLTKTSTGVQIPFGSLSSGEKILMSFAFCIYYSNDQRQLTTKPKVLLLDEVDAPLHPSMARTLIATIRNSLVEKFQIKVIATTHSPSTIALAPEDAIYVMRPGVPGIHKCSKNEALNVLTSGVPTIAISFDGRRQIFVESPIDAEIYDALYKRIKSSLASERSLEFIATGTKSANGSHQNTGCDILETLLKCLVDAGNTSVFGIVDWDGHHTDSPRLAVLAEGRRNGLENVLLDPLILMLLIVRDFPQYKSWIGIAEHTSYIELAAKLEPNLVQPIVDKITALVLALPPKQHSDCEYLNGLKLNIDDNYLKIDDHDLEAKVLHAFPNFKRISTKAGQLMEHIVTRVIMDCPSSLPIEVKNVFVSLLERES